MDNNYSFEISKKELEKGSEWLVGGVSSNFRLNISPTPLVFTHADGALLYDVDGNRLIDYYLGMGPMLLGHTPQPVIDAVQKQVGQSILLAGQHALEYEAAQMVCEMVPCAERVRFGSSGTEVVQAALRLARAATGRETIIKFEGHYHGWLDNILWSAAPTSDSAGSESAPNRVPGSKGQLPNAGDAVEILPWNNLELLAARLRQGDIAAVIMEPIMCNTSAIVPAEGYLAGVRAVCDETGTILIFDEIITGFRISAGGAQAVLGITPDLATFGKAIASGFPVACLAGRADLMDLFVTGGVLHGGTYNSQSVCMAAVTATLNVLSNPDVYTSLYERGTRLKEGITMLLEKAGIESRVQGFPTIFHVAFGISTPITSYRDTFAADKKRYVAFTTALLRKGVHALERGAWFLSVEHTLALIDETLTAVESAIKEI